MNSISWKAKARLLFFFPSFCNWQPRKKYSIVAAVPLQRGWCSLWFLINQLANLGGEKEVTWSQTHLRKKSLVKSKIQEQFHVESIWRFHFNFDFFGGIRKKTHTPLLENKIKGHFEHKVVSKWKIKVFHVRSVKTNSFSICQSFFEFL